jgi:muramoyltetrapeptide carboxypeptidase
MEAVRDPQIGAIFCVRGGFGSSRLLPWLPFPALRSQAKMLLGYSDITFLHLAFWKEMQWVTYHGPNLLDFQEKFANCWPAILTALHGERPFRWDLNDATILRPGVASGILLGGNLTCLVHLLMTPHFPRLEGALLMLEDHGEALYRLDRMLTQLRLAGIFHGINGLVLGQLTAEVEQQEPLREMILDHVQSFEFPVVAGLPFGHGTRNDVVPLGVTYLLNTYERTLTAQQHPFAG